MKIQTNFNKNSWSLYFLVRSNYTWRKMKEDYAEYTKCIGCESSLLLCDCNCPYCGKTTENCHCNLENSRDGDKVLSTTNYSKHGFLKQTKKPSVVSIKDDDLGRLEKWQIGRSRFP